MPGDVGALEVGNASECCLVSGLCWFGVVVLEGRGFCCVGTEVELRELAKGANFGWE